MAGDGQIQVSGAYYLLIEIPRKLLRFAVFSPSLHLEIDEDEDDLLKEVACIGPVTSKY